MIEYIKGEIAELTPTYCVLDNQGIGYLLNISLATYQDIQGQDTKIARLLVYENIREDAYQLYGFSSKDERELFLLLISVSGIGANTARMILSKLSTTELQEAIVSGNVNAIKAVKGIGLKTAQRIIVDLKDKVDKIGTAELDLNTINIRNENANEAVAALVALGFQQQASAKIVDQLLKEDSSMEVARIIKRALSMF